MNYIMRRAQCIRPGYCYCGQQCTNHCGTLTIVRKKATAAASTKAVDNVSAMVRK
ncbi:MAG: hypothetical protein SOS94_10870 [Lachnospiraceae bacterium]|nr:hypothetical protein [Eubacteriales bacterium]MDY2950392.1 hypothetical protein [Lachnospiraceae bacterium]